MLRRWRKVSTFRRNLGGWLGQNKKGGPVAEGTPHDLPRKNRTTYVHATEVCRGDASYPMQLK